MFHKLIRLAFCPRFSNRDSYACILVSCSPAPLEGKCKWQAYLRQLKFGRHHCCGAQRDAGAEIWDLLFFESQSCRPSHQHRSLFLILFSLEPIQECFSSLFLGNLQICKQSRKKRKKGKQCWLNASFVWKCWIHYSSSVTSAHFKLKLHCQTAALYSWTANGRLLLLFTKRCLKKLKRLKSSVFECLSASGLESGSPLCIRARSHMQD